MTIRDAIDAALAARDVGADPASVLAEHGYPDLPADAFSSALLHFAERAPLEVADALAPIVTRLSPVPFEPEDLPESPADDLLDDGADAFALFAAVGPAELDLDDTDPDGFDDHEPLHDGLDDHAHLDDGHPAFEADDLDGLDDGPHPAQAEADDPAFGGGHHDGPVPGAGDPDDDGGIDVYDDFDGPDPFDDADLEPDEAFAPADEAEDFEPAPQPDEQAEALAENLAELAEQISDFRVQLDDVDPDGHLDFDS